jgi:hypothetical protein
MALAARDVPADIGDAEVLWYVLLWRPLEALPVRQTRVRQRRRRGRGDAPRTSFLREGFTVSGGKITAIDALVDPERLAQLELNLRGE